MGMAPLTITTPRLFLRVLLPEDRAEFIRVDDVSREHFAAFAPTHPAEETANDRFEINLTKGQEGLRDGKALRMVAIVREGPHNLADFAGKHAGYFNLNNIIRGAFLNADAGWRTSADLVNRGVATEGIIGMLDLAFAPPPAGLGLHRAQANIQPHNTPSLAVAKRCGFRPEGVGRRMLNIAGDWRDHIMFAKLSEEHAGPTVNSG
jgi:ribosomal-protein-alanine N-acetyltransferase